MEKASEEDLEPAILNYQFRARRLVTSTVPLSLALLNVANSLSSELLLSPLIYFGKEAHLIELNEKVISNYLEEMKQFHRDGKFSASFCLSDHPNKSKLTLWLSPDPCGSHIEQIIFGAPEKFPNEMIFKATGRVCSEFGAFDGYVWDSLLDSLHRRSIRGYELGLASLEPDEHQFLPKPSQIEGIPDTLPPLLLQSEFDYTRVPNGIWWINFWSFELVETVGLQRIRTAPWSRIIEQPNGGLVLVSTDEPTDVRRSDHRERIRELVEYLRLGELQEQFRVVPFRKGQRKMK